jgi:hypothetical protein
VTKPSLPQLKGVNHDPNFESLGTDSLTAESYLDSTQAQRPAKLDTESSSSAKPARINLTSKDEEIQTERSNTPDQRRSQGFSLRVKATLVTLALTTLPVLSLGATTYHFANQAINQQLGQVKQSGDPNVAEISYLAFFLQRQLQMILTIGTGGVAILAGAIAVLLVNRAVRPVLSAAETAAVTAQRLHREFGDGEGTPITGDELASLKANLSLVASEVPTLLSQRQLDAEQSKLLRNMKYYVPSPRV